MGNDWQRLTTTTIRDCVKNVIVQQIEHNQRIFNMLVPPEERERRIKARAKEDARLAAIEAAKSPAQKLREKQQACDHEFPRVLATNRIKCRNCGLSVTRQFVKGYNMGHSNGYDAGRDSVEGE